MQEIEITDEGHCLVDGDDWGEACDVILNHLAGVDPEKPAESLSYRVSRAVCKKCNELSERTSEAEEEASDLRPISGDEIEIIAHKRLQALETERKIRERMEELTKDTAR
jgi:hypothetical protein